MNPNPSRTLTISINRPPRAVYRFVSNPANMPKWATAFCRSIKKTGGKWIMATPLGPVGIRFAGRNAFGVLDHVVTPPGGGDIHVPMRVVPNGTGSEVIFTLFRTPGMTARQLARDAGMVTQDLRTLKRVVEAMP